MNAVRMLCLAACSLMLVADAHVHAEATLRRCTVAGESAQCGSISVPENQRDPHGRQLALGVVVLSGDGGGERREPIFLLAGGPGQAATSLQAWAATVFQSLRRTRDIVLIDQRGSSGTNRLGCALAPGTFFVPADADRCVARLSQTATLSLYGTESFIEDLELVRRTLGYGRIVVYGASYGTRAAYAYARRYPESVRAAVLLAPAPVSMPVLDSFVDDGRRSLDAIVANCLADRACAQAFPHLKTDVEHFRATITDPFRVLGLQFLQYSAATAAHIPSIISKAASGNLAPLDSAIDEFRQQLAEQLALGLHLTIICAEDLSFGATGENSTVRQHYVRACRSWPRVAVSPTFHDAVRLSVPALILVGEWDPVTSPRWARVAANQFSPSQLVILPKASHLLDGFEACTGVLIAGFLDRGAADTSCVTTVRRPSYALR